MLNPLHLRTLATVLRTGSFAAAAHQLGYAPSAVSQQVSALERQTQLVLFERAARSVRPTQAAELLAQRSGEVLALLEALQDDIGQLAGGHLGHLRIGSFPTASLHLVPLVLARLALRSPDVRIVLDEGEPDELLPLVTDRRVDLALVYEYDLVPRSWPPGLVRTTLLVEDLALLLPAGHPRSDAPLTLGDLQNEVWVSTAEGTSGAENLHRASALAGFVPRIDYRTNDYHVVRRLVAAGLGIALVPALGHEASAGVVTGNVWGFRARRKVLAVHRRHATNPCVQGALEACRRAGRRLVDGLAVHRP
ncbi:MAG: LysR family transcriptional regulator [Dermatophilaceae bacterium]|nr:LysR family transcriptional regulator [Dermatophilaceae bacterium]